MLSCRQLAYPRRLLPLDLSLSAGERIALIGRNGSGKSTLLHLLAGLSRGEGALHFDGQAMSAFSTAQLATKRAFLPQQPSLTAQLPLYQALQLGLPPHPQFARSALYLLRWFELEQQLNQPLFTLSGGAQQRFLLTRTLLQIWPELNPRARLLLLDEPLTGLDLYHQQRLFELLNQLSATGILIVSALHDLSAATQWADRVIALDQGHLIWDVAADSLSQSQLEETFRVALCRYEHRKGIGWIPVLDEGNRAK